MLMCKRQEGPENNSNFLLELKRREWRDNAFVFKSLSRSNIVGPNILNSSQQSHLNLFSKLYALSDYSI